LDSRTKIVAFDSIPAILNEGEWVVAAGYFDPLTAEQAVRLANLKGGRRLLALVLDRSDALLPVDARTTLIAALREVDAVAKASELPDDLAVEVDADLASDEERSRDFVEFVLARQMPAAAGAGCR